jgi:hypothetical protein
MVDSTFSAKAWRHCAVLVSKIPHALDTYIVVQHIQAPMVAIDPLEHCLHLQLIGHIGTERHGCIAGALGMDQLQRSPGCSQVEVDHVDRGTFQGKLKGHGRPVGQARSGMATAHDGGDLVG